MRRIGRITIALASLFVTVAGASAAGKPVGITYEYWGAERDPIEREIVALFERKYPFINVEARRPSVTPPGTVPGAAIGPGGADVVLVDSMFVPWFAAHARLAPLEKSLESAGATRQDLQELPPPLRVPFEWNGQLYAVPRALTLTSLVANRQMLDDAALAARDLVTWTDLAAYAVRLTRRHATGQTSVWGLTLSRPWLGQTSWLPFFFSQGGELLKPDQMTPNLASTAGERSFGFLQDLGARKQVLRPFTGSTAGRSSSIWNGGGALGLQPSDLSLGGPDPHYLSTWETIPTPKADQTGQAITAATLLGVGVNAASQHLNEAAQFAMFMLSDEVQHLIAERSLEIPVARETWARVGQRKWNSFVGYRYLPLLGQIATARTIPGSLADPNYLAYPDKILTDVIEGRLAVRQGLERADELVVSLLKRIGALPATDT